MNAPYYTDGDVTLHHGDALLVAQAMPSRSVQTIVTSPPYFGLRDYGHDAQLGAEPTVGEYVGNLVALFRELRRVLADDGTAWINLGDSYVADGRKGRAHMGQGKNSGYSAWVNKTVPGLVEKNLIGVPWRVAFGLQDDGWILRSDIIWAKPNPMPESVTDRPTKAHEYLFLLAKSPRYYYDAAAIVEPGAYADTGRVGEVFRIASSKKVAERKDQEEVRVRRATRNKRTVWEVPPATFPGAHFAVYPPELIRPCILAGSRPGDTVLDPFSGSGTTGMVANAESRKYVGIDLNREYLDLSLRTRFAAPALNIWDAEDAS